jgi:hypothetical protein
MNIIHCIHCGHTIDLGSAYDFYEGPLCCMVCKKTMMVRVEQGKLISMQPGPEAPATAIDTTNATAMQTNAAAAPKRSREPN